MSGCFFDLGSTLIDPGYVKYFVKCIFEEIERHRAEKSVTLTRPAIAGQLKTAIMKADGFTYTTPLHERSRSAGTY